MWGPVISRSGSPTRIVVTPPSSETSTSAGAVALSTVTSSIGNTRSWVSSYGKRVGIVRKIP